MATRRRPSRSESRRKSSRTIASATVAPASEAAVAASGACVEIGRGGSNEVVADRERDGAGEREYDADRLEACRAGRFPGECRSSRDDQQRGDAEGRPERLAEERDCEDGGDDRSGSDHHRGPRWAGISDRTHEEKLRQAGNGSSDRDERPQIGRRAAGSSSPDSAATAATSKKPPAEMTQRRELGFGTARVGRAGWTPQEPRSRRRRDRREGRRPRALSLTVEDSRRAGRRRRVTSSGSSSSASSAFPPAGEIVHALDSWAEPAGGWIGRGGSAGGAGRQLTVLHGGRGRRAEGDGRYPVCNARRHRRGCCSARASAPSRHLRRGVG